MYEKILRELEDLSEVRLYQFKLDSDRRKKTLNPIKRLKLDRAMTYSLDVALGIGLCIDKIKEMMKTEGP